MSIRNKTLIEFLEKYKHTAAQGTEEWLKARILRIGGSEISTILGKNPYNTEKQLIKQHVGLNQFKGYAATFFGNLFEPILQNYINHKFDCFIYETGAINGSNGLGYSPDGLTIIKKNKLDEILNESHIENIKNTSIFDEHDDELLILLEFKCPFKRIPDQYSIPEYYLPQPLLGMEIINICEVGLFIEAVYRFCSIDNLDYNNKYNNIYHNDKNLIIDNPLYYGFMLITYDTTYDTICEKPLDFLDELETEDQFIHNIEEQLNNIEDIQLNINNKTINDLGKLENTWLLNQILQHIIQEKQFKPRYILHKHSHKYEKNIFNSDDKIKDLYNYDIKLKIENEIIDEIDKLDKNEIIIGVLPYKLFQLHIKPVNKEKNFINEKIQNRVNFVIDVIKECIDKPNDEKEEIIEKYYPKNKRTKKISI